MESSQTDLDSGCLGKQVFVWDFNPLFMSHPVKLEDDDDPIWRNIVFFNSMAWKQRLNMQSTVGAGCQDWTAR